MDAQIHQRPATADRRIMMPVAGGGREIVGKVEARRGHLADGAGGQQLFDLLVARVVTLVVADHQLHPVGVTGIDHRPRLPTGERQRLFTEDMFTRIGGLDRLVGVQMGRCCHIDGVNFLVSQQPVHRVIKTGHAMLLGKVLGLGAVAFHHRRQPLTGRLGDCADHLPLGDLAGAENTPVDRHAHLPTHVPNGRARCTNCSRLPSGSQKKSNCVPPSSLR